MYIEINKEYGQNMDKAKLTERIEIRVSPYEKNFIKGLAGIYANGNMSLFLVYAALNTKRKYLKGDELIKSKRKRGKTPLPLK